jgi:cytochrome c oxidase cbb3-type subunit 3
MSTGWSAFVIALVIINVAGSLWLLQVLSRGRSSQDATDTGHVWDADLVELNNPLPRWWLWLFWITSVYLLIYLIFYPGLGNIRGVSGWSQIGQYEQEVTAAEQRYGDVFAPFAQVPLADLKNDPEAVRLGRNIFMNNCATCHGSDARGAKGFPNLTDNDWLYGGAPETVQASITAGRMGVMPALGAALGEQGTEEVVSHLLFLSGRQDVDPEMQQAGAVRYQQFCASCHGADGTGMSALGAPNFTDGNWLHGSARADIIDVINRGRVNEMPAQGVQLSDDRIRTVVAYVLSLSQESGE